MNPILPLFGRNSNLINQNPVTSVDKLVCTFDKCTSYIPRVCVCACVHARTHACVCACIHFCCHYIKIMYHSYFVVYITITLPTVLLVFVNVKLSLSTKE